MDTAKTVDGELYDLRQEETPIPGDEHHLTWYWLQQNGGRRLEITPEEEAELRED